MLLYLVKFSRPDIANSVRELSKSNDGATTAHYKNLLRTIKYVIDTKDTVLKYKIDRNKNFEKLKWEIKAYSDSDFAGDKDNRISITGFCIYLENCLISWRSRAQKHVTLSSSEAEYVGVSEVYIRK